MFDSIATFEKVSFEEYKKARTKTVSSNLHAITEV